MLSIYMATHPNSWLPQVKIPQGSPTAQFPEEMGLYPFRKKARVGTTDKPENFWNSLESKTGDKFGYSYPYVDTSKSAEDIKATFKKFYVWSLDKDGTPPSEMQPLPLTKAQVFDYDKKGSFTEGAAPNTVLSSLQSGISALSNTMQAPLQQAPQLSLNAAYATEGADKAVRQWYIDTSVLRHSQNGAFTLFFFIGESTRINTDTEDYLIKPTLAGLSHIFVAPTEACDNCAQQLEAGARAIDSTAINPMLLDYVKIQELESLEPVHVKPFLIKNLRWRVVTINQDPVDAGDPSLGLKISVSASVYQPPPNDEVPGYETYPEITQAIIQQAGT
jgi:tyrosinase